MPVFTFDPVGHVYALDGVQIPGVTSILKAAGLVPNYGGFGDAQLRGTRVHEACELMDLNDLDLDWIKINWPDSWFNRVLAYQRFKVDTGFVPELIEYQTFHPVFRYGGTLDRRGKLNGFDWILEIKTGPPEDWHGLQLSGYKILRESDWKLDKRGGLYLKEDGSYTFKEFSDPSDDYVFMASASVFNWKGLHGIK